MIDKIKTGVQGAEVDTTDGLKLIFQRYWVHLRPSNTEPIIRVIAEASSREQADDIAERYIQQIKMVT